MRKRIINAMFPGSVHHANGEHTIGDAVGERGKGELMLTFAFAESDGKTWHEGPVTALLVFANGNRDDVVHASWYPGTLTIGQRDDVSMRVANELRERFGLAPRTGGTVGST